MLGEVLGMSKANASIEEFDRSFIAVFSGKPDRIPSFYSAHGFELPSEVWNYRSHQTDTAARAFSGSNGWRICTSQMGSPPLMLRIGDHTSDKRIRMMFGMKCLVPSERCSNASAFIMIERNGEKLWDQARSVNPASIDAQTWSEMVFVAEPSIDVLPDDVVKAFVWGSEGEPFYLDDMWFAMYPAD
jgi:hypothetical protein